MSHINNVENQCIIRLCTNYCYCINIGSNIGPPAVLYRYRSWSKNTISVANIVADPIIGTPLMRTTDTARGITALLPYSCDVDLGRIDHPELEEKL